MHVENVVKKYNEFKDLFHNEKESKVMYDEIKNREIIQRITKILTSNIGYYYADDIDLTIASLFSTRHNTREIENIDIILNDFLEYLLIIAIGGYNYDRCDHLIIKWLKSPCFARFIYKQDENLRILHSYVWKVSAMYNKIAYTNSRSKDFLLINAEKNTVYNFIEDLMEVDEDAAMKFSFEYKLSNYE